MRTVISVEGLGKKYRLNHLGTVGQQTLRDEVSGWLRQGKKTASSSEEFWALRECSFSVRQGERIGIIGRNGAGKSTLLKILSRITTPTTGRAIIQGRVSSLLEVGTGFHPDLSGRENVFLNGAILGMPRSEIALKFDEIVSFAEVERFLDTPVRHYSSGMYVRLAFSIAAHLEPDILIVDEVLSVGDALFQRKCLGKVEEAESAGRTILFVSHNMAMVTSLCPRSLLLDKGRILVDGPTSESVLRYYGSEGGLSPAFQDFTRVPRPVGDELALLLDAAVRDLDGRICPEVAIDQPFKVSMRYRLLKDTTGYPVPNFHFVTAEGYEAFVTSPTSVSATKEGAYRAECYIPGNFLNQGAYSVSVALTTYFDDAPLKGNFYERSALSFNVRDPIDETAGRYGWSGAIPGVVRPRFDWVVDAA